MKTNYVLLGIVFMMSFSLVSADNLFMKAGSNSVWYNQENGLIQTPTEVCGMQSVPYTTEVYVGESCFRPESEEVTITSQVVSCSDGYNTTGYTESVCTTNKRGVTSCTTPQIVNVTVDGYCVNETRIETQLIEYPEVCSPLYQSSIEYRIENVCRTEMINSYNRTQSEVLKAWSINATDFLVEVNSGIMFEEAFTQSKTIKSDGSVKYSKRLFNTTELADKTKHYAFKNKTVQDTNTNETKNFDLLDVEERLLTCEGSVNEILNCFDSTSSYNQLKLCVQGKAK